MAIISRLSRLVNGIQRQVDLTDNTLSLENVRLNLGGSHYITFAGTLTAARTITAPDANVNLGHINNLYTLSGVTAGDTNLGTFTGSTIPDSSTIKSALQSLETAVESIVISNEFNDDVFRIRHSSDTTKKIQFDLSAISTATTRSVIMPNSDVNLGLISTAIQRDGSVTFTNHQSMGGFKLTNLGAPTAGTDAATKEYVDNVAEGLKPKQAARVATTANLSSLSGLLTIDGITVAAGDRVLVKDQTTASQNGIYVASSGTWSRSTDFDSVSPIDEINGALVAVQEGTANAGKVFVQSGSVTTIGTDPINFVFFNSVAGLIGGDGITITGTTIDVDHDGQGLQFSSGQLSLELDGTTLSKAAAGLKVATGGITDNELAANSVITSKINNSAVTTAKIADDAVTTAKINDNAVTSAKIATSVAGAGLTGGGGSPLSVVSAPVNIVAGTMGVSLAANTTKFVRYAVVDEGETAGRLYFGNNDASSSNHFYIVGAVKSSTALSAGDDVNLQINGIYTLGSADTAFSTSDIGKPIYLTVSGNWSLTAPTTADTAVVRLGIVVSTTSILLQPIFVAIN